jgi:hypothetical protein
VKTTDQTGLLDEIRLAQVVLITSTSRLVEAADDLKRDRDHLLELLEQTRQENHGGAPK